MIVKITTDSPPWRGSVSIRKAANLKDALVSYYEDTLKGQGYGKPRFTGTSMKTKNKRGDLVTFEARKVK